MHILIQALFLLTLSITSGQANEKKQIPVPLSEVGMGDSKAPVLIIDYSSLACSHCADFYLNVLPKIEEKYIKPGYVRIVFRDFPGDQVSLKAHQVAWCKGEMKYLDFVKLLYSTQDEWLLAPDPVAALKSILLRKGISADQFDSCIKNQELLDRIIQARLEGQKKYKITATPTLIINAKIYPKALSREEIEKILQPIIMSSSKKNLLLRKEKNKS